MNVQKKIEQWKSHLLCYEVQLLDPEYLAKCVGFTNLMMAWLVRLVDPKGKHPHQKISCVLGSSLSQSINYGTDESSEDHRFPLPNETPEVFRMLPEFLIEDITEFLSFTSKCVVLLLHRSHLSHTDDRACSTHRYAPQVLEKTPQDELMTFMLVFLSTPYMKNPYLKGQFVEVSPSCLVQLFLVCRANDSSVGFRSCTISLDQLTLLLEVVWETF